MAVIKGGAQLLIEAAVFTDVSSLVDSDHVTDRDVSCLRCSRNFSYLTSRSKAEFILNEPFPSLDCNKNLQVWRGLRWPTFGLDP